MPAFLLLLLLVLAQPAGAFVGQLHPNQGEHQGIPCEGLAAILWNYIQPGGPSGAELAAIILREWVPGGWTAQDNTDNQALVALLGPASPLTQAEKEARVTRIEHYCTLWELGVDELGSPALFRAAIGLNP
jgi:hypothetical protein